MRQGSCTAHCQIAPCTGQATARHDYHQKQTAAPFCLCAADEDASSGPLHGPDFVKVQTSPRVGSEAAAGGGGGEVCDKFTKTLADQRGRLAR